MVNQLRNPPADEPHATSEQPEFNLLEVANEHLAKWQPRLKLQDWDIWVEIGDVPEQHFAATSDKEWRSKRAHITFPDDYLKRMRDNGEVPPNTTDSQLVEETTIHELLHVIEEPGASLVNDDIIWICGNRDTGGVFWADFRNAWRDYRECWINHMVRVLLEADRSGGQ